MSLSTQPNLPRPDDFYEALINAHRNPDEEHSAMLNPQFIPLLANHIGNMAVLRGALVAVRLVLPAAAAT